MGTIPQIEGIKKGDTLYEYDSYSGVKTARQYEVVLVGNISVVIKRIDCKEAKHLCKEFRVFNSDNGLVKGAKTFKVV